MFSGIYVRCHAIFVLVAIFYGLMESSYLGMRSAETRNGQRKIERKSCGKNGSWPTMKYYIDVLQERLKVLHHNHHHHYFSRWKNIFWAIVDFAMCLAGETFLHSSTKTMVRF